MRLRLLIVDGSSELLDALSRFFTRETGMEVLTSSTIADAKDLVRSLIAARARLDAALVASEVTDGHGFTFIEWLRNLPDEYVTQGGLRCRFVPTVAMSFGLTSASSRWLRDIDRSIKILQKPFNTRLAVRALDMAIGEYRHEVMIELDRAGLAVTYDNDRFEIVQGYLTRPLELVQTKFLTVRSTRLESSAGEWCCRPSELR